MGNSALLDALRPSSGASGDAIAAAAAVVAQAETQTGAAQAAPGPPEVSNSKSTPHLQEAAAAKAVGALQQSSQALHTAAPDPSSRPVDGKQLPPYEHNVDGGGPVNGLSPSQHQQQLSRASSSAEQLLQQHSASSAPIPTSGDQTPSSPGAKSAGALEAAADSPPTSRHVSEVCLPPHHRPLLKHVICIHCNTRNISRAPEMVAPRRNLSPQFLQSSVLVHVTRTPVGTY